MKLKKRSFIAAAIAMLGLSTAASITGTVAWFTANNTVGVNNMTVTAQAEQGIVIGAYTYAGNPEVATAPTEANFAESVNASHANATVLPTWTEDASTWYHANSKQSGNGQVLTDEGYETVTNTESVKYYLANKFQIKSTGGSASVWVKNVEVTSGGLQAYDAAIRVLVKTSSATLFFDKAGTRTGTETTGTGGDITVAKSFTFTTENTAGVQIMTNVTSTPVDVEIFIFYDGEDASCKSDNIVDFSAATLKVEFTSQNPGA